MRERDRKREKVCSKDRERERGKERVRGREIEIQREREREREVVRPQLGQERVQFPAQVREFVYKNKREGQKERENMF
jgi:hypothetical protein